MEKRKKRSRRFLGKIDGFIDRQEKAFEQKHLKAYLKGQTKFIIGYRQGMAVYSDVKQELIEV